MKNKHFILLGMPKSGTTSIFEVLRQHPSIDYTGTKEPDYLIKQTEPTMNHYIDQFKEFNISLNFHPDTWAIDSKQIQNIKNITSHFAIIFRDPYDLISSLYNSNNYPNAVDEVVDMLFEWNYLNYDLIIDRWKNSIDNKPLLVLYYKDLVDDYVTFYKSIVEFLGIEEFTPIDYKLNATTYKNKNLEFNKNHINQINQMISRFESLTNQQTGWQRI